MTRESEEFTSPLDQAARWSVVFRDGEATPAERREFVEWAAQSPEHVEASLRVTQARAAVSPKKVRWPDTPVEELVRQAQATPGENVVPLRPGITTQHLRPRRPMLQVGLGLAASVLVALLATWFVQSRPEQFQTAVGEQRSVMLADGSRVTLNTATRIEVRLRRSQRDIELIQGEALFEAAHDPTRPFEVHVGRVAVRAVGTEFNIDRRETHTVVSVVEGRVAVNGGRGTNQLPVLSEGDRLTLDSEGSATLQAGIDLREVTAWTERQLVFRNRSLREIAAEFNRYSERKIDIRSASLQSQLVTGRFRADDLASFVSLLASMPGVHVADSESGGYLVTQKENAAAGN